MTNASDSRSGQSIALEQLIALNNEIAALVRAGVPLERGLSDVGREESGTVGAVSSRLAERLKQGQSLPQALAAEGDRIPRVYRVVVEAGLRGGRLPVALEALSGFAWELLELRRKVGEALIYPVIVVALAYGLFLVFVLELIGRFRAAYETFRLPMGAGMRFLTTLAETSGYWAGIPPALLLLGVLWWIIGSRRRIAQLKGLPLIGTKNYRYAMFADLLAIQLEHQVSLDEGVVLAADATGTRRMQQSARRIAEAARRGETFSGGGIPPGAAGGLSGGAAGGLSGGAFPPFLRWLMVRGDRQTKLPEALKLAAEMYRRRAVNRMNLFKAVFPVVAVLVIGGGVTALYALTVFVPFTSMLHGLGETGGMAPFR